MLLLPNDYLASESKRFITIPHFDKDGRFIGLRGRALCEEEAERFGKYRPLKINSKAKKIKNLF